MSAQQEAGSRLVFEQTLEEVERLVALSLSNFNIVNVEGLGKLIELKVGILNTGSINGDASQVLHHLERLALLRGRTNRKFMNCGYSRLANTYSEDSIFSGKLFDGILVKKAITLSQSASNEPYNDRLLLLERLSMIGNDVRIKNSGMYPLLPAVNDLISETLSSMVSSVTDEPEVRSLDSSSHLGLTKFSLQRTPRRQPLEAGL